MDYPHRIEELLHKYWEAETTVEEERELKAFFIEHPEVQDPTASYFNLLTAESQLETPGLPSIGRSKIRSVWNQVAAIAASVALICLIGYGIATNTGKTSENMTYAEAKAEVTDPELAYEQARQALLMVATTMQESQNSAARQIDKVEPYTSIIKNDKMQLE